MVDPDGVASLREGIDRVWPEIAEEYVHISERHSRDPRFGVGFCV